MAWKRISTYSDMKLSAESQMTQKLTAPNKDGLGAGQKRKLVLCGEQQQELDAGLEEIECVVSWGRADGV